VLDVDYIRAQFAEHLQDAPGKNTMDSALLHVISIAYRQGVEDSALSLSTHDEYQRFHPASGDPQ